MLESICSGFKEETFLINVAGWLSLNESSVSIVYLTRGLKFVGIWYVCGMYF